MGKKLFVGNLPFTTTNDDLNALFAQAGSVRSATVMMDRTTGRSRGFGFVELESDEAAEQAISRFNGFELKGRSLNVNEARERVPGSFTPRPPMGAGPRPQGPSGGPGRDSDQRYRPDVERDLPTFQELGGADFDFGWDKPRRDGGSRRGLRAKKRSL